MPELPEVEAVCRRLRRAVGGRIRVARVRRCGTPAVEVKTPGRRIESIERRGKHIFMALSGGLHVHAHLRMSGNLYLARRIPADARLWLELDSGRAVILEDRRALARVDVLGPREKSRLLARLGPEPLSAEFTVLRLAAAARRSRRPVKLFLLDQRRVAGLGNIYAAEALFRARIHPARRASGLGRTRLEALHTAIVGVLRDAVQSAFVAYSGPGGFGEGEAFPMAVYGREREPCLVCGESIRRIQQGGRSTYYCPGCQR